MEMGVELQSLRDSKAGGVIVGRKHGECNAGGDCGVKFKVSGSDSAIEAQGGEVIITAPAVNDTDKHEFDGKTLTNKQILSKINEEGGGVSFARGGQIKPGFKIGDVVRWDSEAGPVSGEIKAVHTQPFTVNGYEHHASTSEPQYEIKSSKSEHIAYHKPEAIHKLERGGEMNPGSSCGCEHGMESGGVTDADIDNNSKTMLEKKIKALELSGKYLTGFEKNNINELIEYMKLPLKYL